MYYIKYYIIRKGNAKECSNYNRIVLISYASKIILKILQTKLQQCMNQEPRDVQPGFRKGTGTRDQIANIHCIIEKAREFQKNIDFCFIDYVEAFDSVNHKKLWRTLKEMRIFLCHEEMPEHFNLPPEKPVCWSRSNS